MSATGRRGESKRMGRRTRVGILAMALATAWALVMAVAAGATTVTVGSVFPPTFTSTPFEGVRTQFNTALPETGANVVSPVNGEIVRWKVAGAIGGPFTLRVLHPNGAGAYTATGVSQPVKPNGPGIETFPTTLSIRSGDLISIDSTAGTDEIGVATVAGSGYGIFTSPPLEGSTNAPALAKSGQEIELAAEVQPAPAITKVTPNGGSVLGGEKVTITGTNLGGASAVTFGGVAASTFTVDSEEKITAVAPPQTKVGRVDITATTLAGESPTLRADSFYYAGCTVPNVVGKKLGAAKATLRGAGCGIGKVTKVKVPAKKNGKVVKQNARRGALLAPGAKIPVKVVVLKSAKPKHTK